MKASSLSILKKELSTLPAGDVLEICLKLVKYKKENKELLTYLLFDANSEPEFIRNIKKEMDLLFLEINTGHIYFAKKSLRKILRTVQKYIKYSGHRQTEVELLIYFCSKMKESGIPYKSNVSLQNIFTNQVRKIRLAIATLHEDLQYDYTEELRAIEVLSR